MIEDRINMRTENRIRTILEFMPEQKMAKLNSFMRVVQKTGIKRMQSIIIWFIITARKASLMNNKQ